MPPQEIVMPLVMGCGLIALGLNPGALWGLKEGASNVSTTRLLRFLPTGPSGNTLSG